jgi:hypothetical protein
MMSNAMKQLGKRSCSNDYANKTRGSARNNVSYVVHAKVIQEGPRGPRLQLVVSSQLPASKNIPLLAAATKQ